MPTWSWSQGPGWDLFIEAHLHGLIFLQRCERSSWRKFEIRSFDIWIMLGHSGKSSLVDPRYENESSQVDDAPDQLDKRLRSLAQPFLR